MLNRKLLEEKLGRKPVIGFTCSTFDLFHPGHVAMLQEAKEQCDYLLVGLLSDPTIDRPDTKNKPVQTMFERWLQVAACKFVDEVVPFQTEAEICDIVLTMRPDIRIVGEEYRDTDFTGRHLCPIYYNSRKHSFSSTNIRERMQAHV
jgi:glycerol-3-phosphate cytidylyltransferase